MIFVSDLHMGGGGDDDDFSPDAECSLVEFLKKYRCEKQCLVGDILELWQAGREEIIQAHKPVFEQFYDNPKWVYHIAGNHDSDMKTHREEIFELGGTRVLAIHGHQFDAANKSGNGLGKYVAQVVGFLERYVHKDIDDWLDRLYGIVKKRASEYDQGMADLAKENDCGIVVYGHTHFPAIKNVDGIAVANCGCWTHRFENGYPYVKIDGNGVVSLKWWG